MRTMNRLNLILALIVLIASTMGCKEGIDDQRISIIPKPVSVRSHKGDFQITQETTIVHEDSQLDFPAQYASTLWQQYLGYPFAVGKESSDNTIVLEINEEFDSTIGDEGYRLNINQNQVVLSANTYGGILYGIQTINQLLSTNPDGNLPCLSMEDYPRFGHRGMHLDVSRHFMPIELIYKLMDYLAMHKMNIFHWHLVDDQGWRLEIKKYPKLTEIGAWRVDMEDLDWDARPTRKPQKGDKLYGGFYTQDEVRAVVTYAAERNITIVPEIEMPAHVMSALSAYPEYSCNGIDLGVPSGGVWPITQIYCAGNDETFQFLEDVLSEVMELFPSPYIHIGGDEADKSEWAKCPKCQKRIADEELKDVDELQSYFIKRIEKFLNSHNRTIIGWDEILEGGLAPHAVVMSWRGEEGGIEAARHGNRAIMTPGDYCYFNFYQGDPAVEPRAMGGYTSLKKVYGYDPIPAGLTDEQEKLIMGAQGNHWAEFILTPEHVEYMAFPRLAALSEVLWSPKKHRDWGNFSKRMEDQYKRYDKLGINYSRSAFQVSIKPNINVAHKSLLVELTTEVYKPEIRYTLDGTEPNAGSAKYSGPIEIFKSTEVKAAVFTNGVSSGQVSSRHFNIHKAFAKEIELEFPNSPRYDGHGQYSLVNGFLGTIDYADGNWKGFLGDDMIATIDLGETTSIKTIKVNALQTYASWIFYPTEALFYTAGNDKEFHIAGSVANTVSPYEGGKLIQTFAIEKDLVDVRFVKVHLRNLGKCPPGHSGEGEDAWLFVDEIIVE